VYPPSRGASTCARPRSRTRSRAAAWRPSLPTFC